MGFNMGELYAESWTSEDLRISRDRPAIVSAMAPWALKPGETLHHLRRRAEAGGRTGGCRGRDHLPDAGPESTRQGVRTYYIKDHYLNYPSILVRLRRIHRDALRDLLRMAWEYVSAKARAPRRPAGHGKRRISRPR